MIVVVFQPYGAKVFFKVPMDKFYGVNVSTHDIEDIELANLADNLINTSDDAQCVDLIECFLLTRLRFYPEHNLRRITATIKEINCQPQITVKSLSDIACLSSKQFKRIFTEYIGITPKEFLRIVRLQRALFVLQTSSEINFVQLACECGFYDQSDLIKEFKFFSGYTPIEYLMVCNPYSNYFSEP